MCVVGEELGCERRVALLGDVPDRHPRHLEAGPRPALDLGRVVVQHPRHRGPDVAAPEKAHTNHVAHT